jgi:Zn-dependent protease with chaperone function
MNKTGAGYLLFLVFGFYTFMISLGLLLVVSPIAILFLSGRFPVWISIWLIGFGFAILAAIRPRRDLFEAPGPEITADDHPEFFQMLQSIASELNERMPDHVYLLFEANAYVTHRGGILGMGSKRILGVGYPLIQTLTRQELLSVMAHEFGHYHGGDTKLAPFVYKTREAIGRSIKAMAESAGNALQEPLRRFFLYFMRVSQKVSRQQEFHADAVAAQVAGAPSTQQALRRISFLSQAWSNFLEWELGPALHDGIRPPIDRGFSAFLQSRQPETAEPGQDDQGIVDEEAHPFDSHPPIKDRIAALVDASNQTQPSDTRLAASYFVESKLEAAVAADIDSRMMTELTPTQWDDVVQQHLLGAWQRWFANSEWILAEQTLADLPQMASDLEKYARAALQEDDDPESSVPVNSEILKQQIGVLVSVVLIKTGNRYTYLPGRGLQVDFQGEMKTSKDLFEALLENAIDNDSWLNLIKKADLAADQPITQLQLTEVEKDHTPHYKVTLQGQPMHLGFYANKALLWIVASGASLFTALSTHLIGFAGLWMPLVALGFFTFGIFVRNIMRLKQQDSAQVNLRGHRLSVQKGKQVTEVDLQQVRDIRTFTTTFGNEHCYYEYSMKMGETTVAFGHKGAIEDRTCQMLTSAIIEARISSLAHDLKQGGTLTLPAGATISGKGFTSQNGELIPWEELVKPEVLDQQMLLWCDNQDTPCYTLKYNQPDFPAIVGYLKGRAQLEELKTQEGGQLGSIRVFEHGVLGWGLLILITSAITWWLYDMESLFWLALLPAWLTLYYLVPKLVRALTTQWSIYRKSVVRNYLGGSQTIYFQQLVSVAYDQEEVTLITDGDGVARRSYLKVKKPDLAMALVQAAAVPITNRMVDEMYAVRRIEWLDGVVIYPDRLEGKKGLVIPFDQNFCSEQSGILQLFYSSKDPHTAIKVNTHKENFHPGYNVLCWLLRNGGLPVDQKAVQQFDQELAVYLQEMQVQFDSQREQITPQSLGLIKQDWVDENYPDTLATVYDQHELLLQKGRLVWGYVLQCNGELFNPQNRDPLPGYLIYCEHEAEQSAGLLVRLGTYLFSMREREPNDVDLKHVNKVMTGRADNTLKLQIPTIVTEGRTVYYTGQVIHPDTLVEGYLRDQLVPLIIAPEYTEATLIAPKQVWSEGFIERWQRRE